MNFQVNHWVIGLCGCQVRCCTLRCSSGSLQSCRARAKLQVYLCTARESLMQSLWVSFKWKEKYYFLMKMKTKIFSVKELSLFLQSFPSLSVSADQNETVLVFRGSVYWTVSADGGVSSPLPLRQRWPGLPQAIEAAAFSPLDSKWYFFKGTSSLNSFQTQTFLYNNLHIW